MLHCLLAIAAANLGQVERTVYAEEALPAYATAVLADRPLLYYRFEEAGGGIAYDASTNGFHGAYANVAHATTLGPLLGHAAVFNGTNSNVTVPALTKLGLGTTYHQVTIEAWIKVNTFVNPEGLECIYNHDGWSLGSMHTHVNRGSRWGFGLNGNSPSAEMYVGSPGPFSPNTWYHLAAVYDADAKRLDRYVNGQLITNITYSAAVPVNLGAAHIGAWNGNSRFFNGLIDELAIYGRVLTPDRITAHYQAAVPELWITAQPRSQAVLAGTNATLTVTATGAPPLGCQWWRNGVMMAGATNAALMLTNAQPKDSGTYWVVVSNSIGRVTSTKARLMVNHPSAAMFPMALTGWNFDVIFESGVALPFAQSFDGYNGAWFEAGARDSTGVEHFDGLPASREFTSAWNTNVLFTLQPATANNVLLLQTPPGLATNTLALAQPREFRRLAVLAASGSGNGQAGMWLNFADGSRSLTLKVTAPDWATAGAAGVPLHPAITGLGRCGGLSDPNPNRAPGTNFVYDDLNPLGFNLHETDIDLEALGLSDRKLVSLTFAKTAGSIPFLTGIFGVSGQPTPPPSITLQAASQTVTAGADVALMIATSGAGVLSYQWWRNGVMMAGATNAALTLTNAQPKDSGTYWVVVSNAIGRVTSARARLMVNYPSTSVSPVALTGWNRDVVAENAATPVAQFFDTAKFGDVWREAGLAGEEAGLPQSRRFTSAANTNVNFELQPYTTNNVLWLNPATGLKSATLELAVPQAYTRLAIASASTFGATTPNQSYSYARLVLHFEDGTDSGPLKYLTLDWFDYSQQHNASVMALAGLDYAYLNSPPGWLFGAGYGVGLYETDLDLAAMGLAAKQLTAITFTGVTNNPTGNPETTAIFAISGEPAPSPALVNLARLSDGNFAFHITGLAGQVLVLLGSSDLTPPVAWIPVATNLVDTVGVATFSDLEATNYLKRFYQVKQK